MLTVKPRIRRWTRTEFYRMADLGLFRGERVELIDGEVVQMPAQRNLHAVTIGLTDNALRRAFGTGYWIRSQMPLHLGPRSAPEPDFAVVRGGPRDFAEHPTTALLLVEVSDSSLTFDRGRKAAVYARAGILDYWIVNLVDRQLEVYRSPEPHSERRGFRFAQFLVFGPHDSAAPLAVPNSSIAVAELLP